MSRKSNTTILCSVSVAVIVCVASVLLKARALNESSLSKVIKISPQPKVDKSERNLSLHSEALRASRHLGKRFDSSSRGTSVLVGNLRIAENQRPMVITRRQTDFGETVELRLVNNIVTWSADEGIQTKTSPLTESERMVAERLIFDSPDYFVLAQLRGASYFTVARNVRPPDAPDNYTGPLWTIVRVDERQKDEALPPSSWRLYYINSNTGLIDRIVSRLGEQTIEAEIVSWMEQSGEKVPARIIWTSESQPVMSYHATSLFHNKLRN